MNDPSGPDGAAADLPFRPIAELIREHARAAPRQPALVDATSTLDYGALDALMDRVAASLQRDGVAPGEAIAICALNSTRYAAIFLGALRAGVVVAPLAASVTPASFRSMVADAGARLLFVDASADAVLGDGVGLPARISLDGKARGTAFDDWLAPAGSAPKAVEIRAEMAVQHHLFVGHDRHAQGHRPAARHALDARHARRPLRLLARHRDAAGDAALLEHDAGRLLSDRRLRRHRRADGQVRRRPLPRARRAPPRHPHDAGAGAVPAPDGEPALRRARPVVVPHEVLHQRAVRGGAQGRRRRALAGRPGRVLRHDRRRRHLHPRRARASDQAAHRRPAGRGPRHPPHRRGRPRAAARRDRRGRRPLGRHDERLPRPARRRRPRPSGSTPRASASSAPATSAASTTRASSPSSIGART